MSNYKVQSKILINYEPAITEITLVINDSTSIVRQKVKGDHRNAADDVAIELTLAEFYKEHFASKFQNEAIERLNSVISNVQDEVVTVQTEVKQLSKVVFAKDLSDEEKEKLNDQYPNYEVGQAYKPGDVVTYEGELFEVVQAHTSQEDWQPSKTASLYKPYLKGEINEKEVVHDFQPPLGAHDAYQKGDKVSFEGQVWRSTIDNNTWSPRDYPQGWEVVWTS